MDKRRGPEESIISENVEDIKSILIDNERHFPVYRLFKEKKKKTKKSSVITIQL